MKQLKMDPEMAEQALQKARNICACASITDLMRALFMAWEAGENLHIDDLVSAALGSDGKSLPPEEYQAKLKQLAEPS